MTSRTKGKRLSAAIVCFSSARGGLELMLVRLGVSIKKRGHAILFFAPPESPINAECKARDLPFAPLAPTIKYLDFFAALKIAHQVRQHEIQVLVVGTSKDISTCVLAKMLNPRLRVVYLQQMQFGIDKRDLFHRWSYSKLDQWITLTRAMRSSVIQRTTVPGAIIDVIPFGADRAIFSAKKFKKTESRKKFGLPRSANLIAVIGRFDEQKGQEYLLRATPAILRGVPGAHIVMVGEETKGEEGYLAVLTRIVRQLSLEKKMTFLPFTTDVAELLSALDLVVMPSFSETFGYVAIEAMVMGLPVVGTDAGGLPEIIEDGKTGLLVPPREVGPLAESIVKIMKNKRLYATMSAQARKRAMSFFDFEKNVDAFVDLLFRVIG